MAAVATAVLANAEQGDALMDEARPTEDVGNSQAPNFSDVQALFALMRPGEPYSAEQHAALAAQLRDMAARLDPGESWGRFSHDS